jgi:hypothetical protein
MNEFGRYTWPEMTNPIPQNVQYLILTAKLVSLCVLCQILRHCNLLTFRRQKVKAAL